MALADRDPFRQGRDSALTDSETFFDPLAPLIRSLGVDVTDRSLIALALTHPSAGSGRGPNGKRNNQRLEFLGDRVLGLVVADMLYRRFPDEDEGALAKRFADLVKAHALAMVAKRLKLGDYMILGAGEAVNRGASNPSSLADACEALIGALFIDSGLEQAAKFVETQWAPLMERQHRPPRDAKTALQEWAQGRGFGLPTYRVVSRQGPDHAPRFEVAVSLAEREESASATGESKRTAERAAAQALLRKLETDGDD